LSGGELRVEPALFHGRREEPESCLAQGPVRSGELRENFVAVSTLIDHGLETTKLSLDSLESFDDVVTVLMLKFHASMIPPGVIKP
jgi:hypothetical protein